MANEQTTIWRWLRRSDPVLSDGRQASVVRASMLGIMFDCNRLMKEIAAKLQERCHG